ncbi:MAG: DUF3108 domain-containing protein [Betaproteobacteria bacterium]|nr:DUF3108 domain-containing protein [Betaproteobacteria bacterium]
MSVAYIRLLTATAVSLLVHVLLLAGNRFDVPGKIPEPPPLRARLAREELPPPPAVKPAPRKPPAPRRRASPPVRPVEAPVAGAPVVAAPEPEPVGPLATAPEPAPAAPPEPPPAAEPEPEPQPEPARRLPKKGSITYALFLGTDKFNVGQSVFTWEIDDQSYRLTSVSETTGLAGFFRPYRLAYVSRGRVNAHGLQPESFVMARIRSGEADEAAARFDWNAMSLALGSSRSPRTVALAARAQDLVSFIYQLGLMPLAPGRIAMPITNGARLETYELEVGAEETLQTPIGALKALPVKQVRKPDAESLEIWLAVEYRYLPVKIRFLDRQGEQSGEQIVSEIRVSDH